MTELTTSATKLYQILKEFQDYKTLGDDLVKTWGKILGAKNISDPIEVSGKLSQLFILCNEVKLDVKAIENIEPKEIYLKAIARIEWILLNNNLLEDNFQKDNLRNPINIGTKTIQSKIHPDTLGVILSVGTLIKEKLALKEIDSNELEELKQKINSLRDEIEESDIEADLKKFLKEQLNKIETAIDNFQIRSSSGLDKTIKEVLGNIILTVPTLWQGSKEGREKTMNVINFLVKINGYISLGERIEKISEFMQKFLPPSK